MGEAEADHHAVRSALVESADRGGNLAVGAIARAMGKVSGGTIVKSFNDVQKRGIEPGHIVFRDELEKATPYHFLWLVAEHALGRPVLRKDDTSPIHHHDDIRRTIEDGLQALFTAPQMFLRVPEKVRLSLGVHDRVHLAAAEFAEFRLGIGEAQGQGDGLVGAVGDG